MDENNKQSMEEGPTQFLNTKANLEESEGEDEKDEEDEGLEAEEYYEDEEDEEQTGVNELEGNSTKPIGTEPLKSETLAVSVALASPLQVSNSDLLSDFSASSPLLSEVPVEYSLQLLDSNKFKDQVGVNHQKALLSVPADAFVAQPLNQFPLHRCTSSSSGLSPASVTRPTFSGPGPTPEQKLLSAANGASECVPEAIHQNYSNHRTGYTASTGKASSSDGYNWRKYGQKQVKSPQGSRSYYKCTCSECRAKKIECCDQSSRVVEIIYKGQHNHDPPQKVKSTRESRLALSAFGSNISSHPVRMLTDLDPSTSSRQHVQEGIPITETKQENLSGSDGDVGTDVMEEYINEPEPKRRVKQGRSEYPETFFKSGKKPKFVLHAAGDVGISGDGYRWRKYGQKMVKGNPHPRNYYRCTSAGCPVRKHIERAVDSTTGVIITYKGVHDHDMPVPKKRHGPPSASLVAAAAPTSMNNLQFKKTEVVQDQVSATKWSVDKEGELTSETLDHGGEKAMESARTLLSIGFEIKPF